MVRRDSERVRPNGAALLARLDLGNGKYEDLRRSFSTGSHVSVCFSMWRNVSVALYAMYRIRNLTLHYSS
jgi:hypothetical protein